MKISHPKVKRVREQAERRIRKLTGEDKVLLVIMNEPDFVASFNEVVNIVCDVRHQSVHKVFSRSRKREFVIGRQLISYYAYKCCGMTLEAIANRLIQDHTTVIHSIRTIQDLMETGSDLVVKDIKTINVKLKQLSALAEPAPTNGTAADRIYRKSSK